MTGSPCPARTRATLRHYLIPIAGTLLSLLFGYWYSSGHVPSESWYQRFMGAAVNFACTGHFASIELTPDASAPDKAALNDVDAFLHVHRLDYACKSFPRVVPKTIFDGIGANNGEQPYYLVLLYGLIWRLFGVHWEVTYYVVAAGVTFSFWAIYLCARPFAPQIVAAGGALLFMTLPVFITTFNSPRDALKFPFGVVIAASLIGAGTAVRTPSSYLLFACGIGGLIGVGYGFRSDLLLFVVPAILIIAVFGQPDLGKSEVPRVRRVLSNCGVRFAAAGAVLMTFGVGGSLPLANDLVFSQHSVDGGYHILAMGLAGRDNYSLFQSNSPNQEMYMYRNNFGGDEPVEVRIMEYALRHDGKNVSGVSRNRDTYWPYAKKYFLAVARLVPGDLLSRGVGSFVNLMSLPASLAKNPPQFTYLDASAPWATTYDFARNVWFVHRLAARLDRFDASLTNWPIPFWFWTNIIVLFCFLCLLDRRFNARSIAAAVVVLVVVLAVTSLKFELRHIFYIYTLLLVAWIGVVCSIGRRLLALLTVTSDSKAGGALLKKNSAAISAPLQVAVAVLVITDLTVAALLGARIYQIHALRAVIADMVARPRRAATYEISELPPGPLDVRMIPAGMSRIKITSPMPLSTGGYRSAEPPEDKVQMGVVAVTVDGRTCNNRLMTLTGISDYEPHRVKVAGTVSQLWTGALAQEPFTLRLRRPDQYMAFLPAFYFTLSEPKFAMFFVDLELQTSNVTCVSKIEYMTKFKSGDVLFDFFVPKDPAMLSSTDLFQRVEIPGLGFL